VAGIAALVLGGAAAVLAHPPGGIGVLIALALAVWVWITTLQGIWARIANKRNKLGALLSLPAEFVGMTLAHIGLGVCVIAIATVETYTVERDAAIAPGETLALGRYAYRFESIREIEGPNYNGVRAEVTVLRDGQPVATLHPERRNYWVQRSTLTEAGIASRWNMDMFVALSEELGEGRWSVRAQLRPLIDWIWYAAALMAFGGVLAATDRRYRTRAITAEHTVNEGARAEAT
jgi:cytochrome c-type biogenesis protein CcmF